MAEELTQEQLEQSERLAASRREDKKSSSATDKLADKVGLPTDAPKMLSEHWLIFCVAGGFDLVALIPAVSIVTNPIFGGILFLYLAPKRDVSDLLLKITLRTLGFTILDAASSFVPLLDLVPLNIANTYYGVKSLKSSGAWSVAGGTTK